MTVLIQTTNLSVQTKSGEQLVEPISLSVKKGHNLIILGETGSGKSLLAQAIMGALPSDLSRQGEVTIVGQPQGQWGKQIAMLAQEPTRSLDPTMSIQQQVWESFYFVAQQDRLTAQQKTLQKLTALGLEPFINYYPHQLSGGMAQRAAFAMATASGAYIVIADEPTKGLDQKNKNIVIQLLAQIAQQGGALLVITHDIDVAKQLGGEIMVMKKGKLLEQGDSQQLFIQPRSHYAKQLIAAAPENWQAKAKPQRNAQTLLTVKDLSIARGKRRLFSTLNFSLNQGEVLGLVGESGIGKSSLGDCLCGLLAPHQGEICWQIPPKPQQVLKLYQDPPSAFAGKIKLQILLDDVINKHNLDRRRIPYLLEQLKLDPAILQRTAENVSGGELQRIAILRALLFNPVLLFADEVTSRLDPITQQETMDLLVEQCNSFHCALIIVSHDHHLVNHYCDQVIDLTHYSCFNLK
ncbi:ABC transporter ATP-binding protein [Volucribacter amazonae]|uniref:ABC transporter ATP-binding protein n=1 Tax=Volucribacter amazonae TaxID=256731 RepID=A0A9X4P9T8_9PAST|nr:ATP-binding cassette domain-containing protein [Volucribacter amazonae]MDG6895143.1 ABC transporter ATP-binding protein [Volucribacter amazonae]